MFGFTRPELWGVITGAWCVWLVARQSLWNFPIGIVNNLFFGVLFFQSRLYSDMSLQGVYLILGDAQTRLERAIVAIGNLLEKSD